MLQDAEDRGHAHWYSYIQAQNSTTQKKDSINLWIPSRISISTSTSTRTMTTTGHTAYHPQAKRQSRSDRAWSDFLTIFYNHETVLRLLIVKQLERICQKTTIS